MELTRYIAMNPVRAGMVRSTEGLAVEQLPNNDRSGKNSGILENRLAFGVNKSATIKRYIAFVSAGKGESSPWQSLRNQVYLGSEKFVEEMQAQVEGDKVLSEIPLAQRMPVPRPLRYYEVNSKSRLKL